MADDKGKPTSRHTVSNLSWFGRFARNVIIVFVALYLFWFFFGGLFKANNTTTDGKSSTPAPAASAPAISYCAPVPASFLNGTSELRFPRPREGSRGGPLCYDIVLGTGYTSYVFAPLENKSGELLVNLITPGKLEVQVMNGGEYSWTANEESLARSSVQAGTLRGEKCAIFRVKGTGTARVIVDRYESPGRSAHCPGMR